MFLTEEESKTLSMSIDAYIADEDPGASLNFGVDVRMIRSATRHKFVSITRVDFLMFSKMRSIRRINF